MLLCYIKAEGEEIAEETDTTHFDAAIRTISFVYNTCGDLDGSRVQSRLSATLGLLDFVRIQLKYH
jgi:hypothetical protein